MMHPSLAARLEKFQTEFKSPYPDITAAMISNLQGVLHEAFGEPYLHAMETMWTEINPTQQHKASGQTFTERSLHDNLAPYVNDCPIVKQLNRLHAYAYYG